MIQNNLTKILLVVLAAGALLTAYNAFVNSNNDSETNASTKLANFLSIDRAQQAVEGAEDIVAGTDNQPVPAETSAPAETPAPETPVENTTPEPTPTPATEPATPAPAVAAGDKAASVYTVKEGDTYGCIAEAYYGSLEHYTDIMAANPVYDNGFGEYSLHVGAQLVLPAITAAHLKPASNLCQ